MYHSTSIVNTNLINCSVRTIDKSEAPKKLESCDLRSVSMPFLLFCLAVNTSSHSPSIVVSDLVICRSEPTLLQTCSTPGFSSPWNNEALYFVFRVMANLRFLWEKERERAKTRMRMQTMRRKRNVFVLVVSLQSPAG